jgi:hypothetical protein
MREILTPNVYPQKYSKDLNTDDMERQHGTSGSVKKQVYHEETTGSQFSRHRTSNVEYPSLSAANVRRLQYIRGVGPRKNETKRWTLLSEAAIVVAVKQNSAPRFCVIHK